MSNLSLREIAQSQLDSTPVIDGQLIVCLDTGNAYRDTATAHVKIGSDLEVVNDLPLAPLAEKIYYLKPDKLYVFLGGNWTLLNDKTIDLDESIAKLPVGSSTVLNDDVEIITQDTDITQSHYYRRKLVVLWEYIKTKAQDFFAAKNHQHGKADITDFPTSMPASDVYPWAKAATKPSYTKAEIGLGKVDNTADADKTVKRATTAGTADSANSVAWGNVRDKPTTFPVEAHNHDDRYYTEAEVNSKLSGKVDNTKAGANGLINKLSTADGIPNDATVFISQHNDGKTASYYRRPISTLWTYIKSKADSVYQPKGSYAASNHSHDDRYYTESEMDGKLNSKVNNNEAGANGLLSKLTTSWTAAPTDDTYFIRQDIGGGNQFGRVKFSTIWNYIKGKTDGIYQPKGSYASSGHTHDDRYYTESEMNTKLSKKAENIVLASDANLNNITTPGFYSCGGGNKITNKPNNTDAIGLIVTHNASGSFYTQILTTSSNTNTYRRTCLNGTWSGWTQDKYTDTNTWRGIQNNLTSNSTSDSLSAAQGKALKSLVDGKAPKEHTHTKSQITDFPASLKNPTALTIQTNGTTAATYDGSAAKTVNITKSNIGLGNVDNTADKNKSVASAAKLTTARTVSGGSDIVLDFKYDGSGNSTANIGFYSCRHFVGNTNNYPFHRFAKLENLTGAYTDRTMLVYITQDYNGGGFGICRLSVRTNNSSSASTVEAKWLVRSGLSADFVQVAIYNVYGKTYADAFIKTNGTYAGTTVRSLSSGSRVTSGRTWTLVNSNEVDGTTATDKKTSSECWKTIAEAGTAIHKQVYPSSASATDNGYAASAGTANSAASCTGNSASATKLTSSAGSAIQPVYFKDGKPVAGTYTLGDASSKIVRTLGAVGNTGWANKTTDDKYVPTMSFMAYWNGAYSSTSSNLQYCDRGRFGTIVTKNSGDYAVAGHTHSFSSITGKPSTYPPSAHNQSWGTITGKPALMESGGYHAETIEALLKQVQGLSPRMGSCIFTKDTHVANTWWNFIYTPHRTGSGEDNPDYGTLLLFPMVGAGSSYIIRAGKDGIVREVRKIYTSGDKPTKGDVGLGNVDNTADANKSVASAAGIKDAGDDRTLTLAYSKDGLSYKSYSWLAGWNGNELRTVNKNQFATAEHGITASGSNYVRFGNGIQICWGYKNESNGGGTTSFAVAFNNTSYALALTATTASNNAPFITGYTTTGFSYDRHGTAWDDIQWIAVGTWK